jgi:hypothetical protein
VEVGEGLYLVNIVLVVSDYIVKVNISLYDAL